MKRTLATITACAGLAVVAVPAAVAAPGDNANGGQSDAAKACTQLKKADRAAFRATYGKYAMRTCLKGEEPVATETSPADFKSASRDCRAERREDPEVFQETYGSNRNKRNALGKCVSAGVKSDGQDDEGSEDGGDETPS